MIIPIILTSQPKQMVEKTEERAEEKSNNIPFNPINSNGPQLLEELGLLEDDMRDHIPFLRRQQTSHVSNTGQ